MKIVIIFVVFFEVPVNLLQIVLAAVTFFIARKARALLNGPTPTSNG